MAWWRTNGRPHPVLATWEALQGLTQAFRRAAEDAGHDPAGLPIIARVNGAITGQPPTPRAPMTGTIDQVSEDLHRLAALGITHVFWFMPGTEPDQQLDAMQELLAAIPS